MKEIRANVYYPLVTCNNCELFQNIIINDGVLIRDSLCPNCKCQTLELMIDRKDQHTNYKD